MRYVLVFMAACGLGFAIPGVSGRLAADELQVGEPASPQDAVDSQPQSATAKERRTPPPAYQPPVNFRTPQRELATVQLDAWTVLVEKQLLDENPELSKKALDRLRQQLAELKRRFPDPTKKLFQKLTLFLMYGEHAEGGGRNNGLEYFQRHAPAHFEHLDPRMASSILIYSADNYVWLPERRALMALAHEFSHAYQLEQWPETEPRIYDTWDDAMARRLYHKVKHEDGSVLERGYAAVNQLEYFAELSMVYFVGGYYTPFSREELKTYDPQGYEMVRSMWKLDDSIEGPSD